VVVNGVDLSDHVRSVSLVLGIAGRPAHTVADIQDYEMPGTQVVQDPTIAFYQDYAAGEVYATLMTLWQNRTTFNLVVKNDAGATSVTNQAFTVPVFVKSLPVLSGERGNEHMADVTCGVAGPMTIATS